MQPQTYPNFHIELPVLARWRQRSTTEILPTPCATLAMDASQTTSGPIAFHATVMSKMQPTTSAEPRTLPCMHTFKSIATRANDTQASPVVHRITSTVALTSIGHAAFDTNALGPSVFTVVPGRFVREMDGRAETMTVTAG